MSSLFEIDPNKLQQALTTKKTKAGHQNENLVSNLSLQACYHAKESMIMSIYKSVFDYVIRKINEKLKDSSQASSSSSSNNFIGVLDMAGFEYFEKNSYEQFSINYSNEYLQKYFNDNVIKNELNLYKSEGLISSTQKTGSRAGSSTNAIS